MRDWEPIGAGGESGMTAGDPLHPGIVFGGNGAALRSRAERADAGHARRRSCSRAKPARTDWTQPLVFSKADPHALYYANQFLFKTTDGAQTWTQISPDLTRPDPGVPPNLDADGRRRHRSQRQARRHLRGRAVAAPGADGLDRHRRRVDPAHDRRRQDVAERDAAGAHVVEPRHDDRGVALRRERGVRLASIAISSGLRSVHLSHARPRQDVAGDHARAAARASTCTSSRKIRCAGDCSFAGTERGVFVSFDDGDTWQSLQLNLPVTSVRDFEIYGNDLIVGDARPRILGDRRHQPAAADQRRGRRRRRVSLQAGGRDQRRCRAATTARRCRRTSRRRRIRRTARPSTTT